MCKVIFLGDIVGKVGRGAVKARLPELIAKYEPDLVVANGENAAGGLGLDPKTAEEIYSAGVNVITTGNHVWKHRIFRPYLDKHADKVIRPCNFPPGAPGIGGLVYKAKDGSRVAVINAIGRVFMTQLVDCPFRGVDEVISQLPEHDALIVDFHGEATSEKIAMGHYLNGRATLVVGTHTHVQTADNHIMSKGTAYISDLGMCGPRDGVIGVKSDVVVNKFVSGLPDRFELATGPAIVNGVFIDIDIANKGVNKFERIFIRDGQ